MLIPLRQVRYLAVFCAVGMPRGSTTCPSQLTTIGVVLGVCKKVATSSSISRKMFRAVAALHQADLSRFPASATITFDSMHLVTHQSRSPMRSYLVRSQSIQE